MKLIKKYLFMIAVLSIATFSGCGADEGGIVAGDIDDGLSSNYFIKNLVMESPDLIDETDPNATIIDLKWDFMSGVWKNEATVLNKVTRITITAVPNMYATMYYLKSGGEEKELLSGTKSDDIILDVGVNIINIRVVAEDLGELVYEFKITRQAASYEVATLNTLSITDSKGTLLELSPEFVADSAGSTYSTSIGDDGIVVTAVPTSTDAKVEMIVNDLDDPDDAVLNNGINKLVVTCTSGDNAKKETYTVNINRQASGSTSTNLSALSIDGLDISPLFNSSVTSYSATATSSTISLSAQPEDSGASYAVTLDGASVDPAAITLGEGENTIAVTVTNPTPGSISTTYTITVSYSATQLSSNANLKTLKVTADGEAKVIHPGNFSGLGQSSHDAASVKFTSATTDYVTVIAGKSSIVVTAAVDDLNAKSVVFSGKKYFGAARGDEAGGIDSQSFSGGTATATVSLDKGYVTDIAITVTAQNDSTKTYHLYTKLLNNDEFHWGVYAPAWDKSKSAWSTPSGISDKTYNGMVTGTSRWRTGLSNNTYEGVSYGAKSEIILTNFNDGQNGILYNEGGHILNGTQFTYLKSATSKNGYNATPVGTTYTVTTAGGKALTSYNYHVKVTSSETVMHAEGTTDPTQQSYTEVTYMGVTHIQYYRTGTAKPVPFGSTYNWFEPWSDKQWPGGATNVDNNPNPENY